MRISKLNQNYGLYEVTPDIYQVSGFDQSDIFSVRGKTGWICIDPLISAETARAAINLFREHVGGNLSFTAVIYSHSHGDHFLSDRPDRTLPINRSDLEMTMTIEKDLVAQIADGAAQAEGDLSILASLAGTMVDFDPNFEILPGTKRGETEIAQSNAFEEVPGSPNKE